MGDPALDAARELVSIPVIGPAQASMSLASMLGERFSVVTVLRNVVPLFWRLARKYGLESRLSSVRYIEIPVLEIEKEKIDVETKLINESKKAIEEDGADVIILGCTGFIGLARKIQETLHVPVIDPAPAALKFAESLIDLKLTTSKWILEKVKEAEEKKFDAVIIDCMGDPALDAARELVSFPVIGPVETDENLCYSPDFKKRIT
jgi:allantoin racemase